MTYTEKITAKTIEEALNNEELVLHYQPQSSLISGEINGVEALVRWQSKIFGNVNPAYFIKIIEHSKIQLIAKFHEWVLRTAFKQILAWQRIGISVPVHINFSTIYLQQQECLVLVKNLMQEYSIQPSWFGIEVTESSPITDFHKMKFTLDSFRDMGIEIALDDFCTSYCSLEYLSDLPATKIKIDKQFIHKMGCETKYRNEVTIILESMIEMTTKLGIEIVAEGVESVKHLEQVTFMGFDTYQGYFLCPPVPADLAAVVIRGEKKAKISNSSLNSFSGSIFPIAA